MSVFEKTSLACPACGTTIVADLVHSVNAVRRPDLRAAILDRSFSTWSARPAGWLSRRADVHLPRHRRKQFIAAMPATELPSGRSRGASASVLRQGLRQGSGASSLALGMQARCVFGWLGLNEKLIALEHGIDDVALEMAKLATLRAIGNVKLGVDREFRLVGATADTLALGWLHTSTEEIDEEYSVPRRS
jgi:hypothetical protein